jgi:hypothetical protein
MEEEVKKGRKAKEVVTSKLPTEIEDWDMVFVSVGPTVEKTINGAASVLFEGHDLVVTGAAWNVASQFGTINPSKSPFSTVDWTFKGLAIKNEKGEYELA